MQRYIDRCVKVSGAFGNTPCYKKTDSGTNFFHNMALFNLLILKTKAIKSKFYSYNFSIPLLLEVKVTTTIYNQSHHHTRSQ